MLLSEFLKTLNFPSAKQSSEYIGTKEDNPGIILEENISKWIHLTSIEDLQECLKVFTEQVCISNFPERFSPQYWLAHSSLTAIYRVMCGFVNPNPDLEVRRITDTMLFDSWMQLMAAGPGSSHLEMVNIILKNNTCKLWKHMQNLTGEKLVLLVTSLKRDYVYAEHISADHYATLMETHIDKVFKTILTGRQVDEARRGLLDLHMFYLSRMNHVPPHIGPRLSHLCFLICSRYEHENPFMGQDDWVLLRHHLKGVKDVIVDPSFRVASEAQYRAPKTLEKIFLAAVHDGMLDVMFKDFMSLLQTICNHGNSRSCKRLFHVYQESLFDQIDFKKGFENTPYWLFDQCIQTLHVVCKTVSMDTHIDEIIIHAQNACLMNFTKLKPMQIKEWHSLVMNYIVSGRVLLVREATLLLTSQILTENQVFIWKDHIDQGRMLVDIVADLPSEFLECSEDRTTRLTVQAYADFIAAFLIQIRSEALDGRFKENVQMCLLKCLEKNVPHKAAIAQACLLSEIPNIKDASFIRDVLFCVDNVLKDPNCPIADCTLTSVLGTLLSECLDHFRSKGYFTVDANSLLASITLSCISADLSKDVEDDIRSTSDHVLPNEDMFNSLYKKIVLPFISMHREKQTLHSVSHLVQEVIYAVQNSIQRNGTGHVRCVHFLTDLGTMCVSMVTSHVTSLVELFLNWGCFIIDDLLMLLVQRDIGAFLAMFQEIFDGVQNLDREIKHRGMRIVERLSHLHPEVFNTVHVRHLLDRYDEESESTQALSLKILLNIANHQPRTLAQCFHILIDDSKFQVASLPGRIRIFEKLQGISDEYPQSLTDYVVRFLDSKNSDVTSAATEFLGPLLHENPKFLVKHRVRLKSLWKSTSNQEVKKFCVKVLPEIQTMHRINQATSKSTQETVQTSSSGAIKKESIGIGRKFDSKKSLQTRQPKSDFRLEKTNVTKTSINVSDAKERYRSTAGDNNDIEAQIVKGSGDVPNRNAIQTESTDVEGFVKNENSEHVVNINKEEKTDRNSRNEFKEPRAGVESVNSENILNTIQENNVAEIRKVQIDNAHGNHDVNGMNTMKTDSKLSETPLMSPKRANVSSNNVSKEDMLVQPGSVGSRDITMLDTHAEKVTVMPKSGLILIADRSSLNDMQELSVALTNVGYVNSVLKLDQEFPQSTKMIIYTVPDTDGEIVDTRQMTKILEGKTSKICVLFRKVIWPNRSTLPDGLHTVLEGKEYIRLYAKNREACSEGTKYSRDMLTTLLMRLNYNGVITSKTSKPPVANGGNVNEDSLTSGTMSHNSHTCDVTSGTMSHDSHTCDVYISYHWSKQTLVESLCRSLSALGFRCWLASQRMGGSDSLYSKISQGIQEARVVVACITSNYHSAVECQRDIAIAKSLGRPIVPLLLAKNAWPVRGEMGKTLSMYQSISQGVSSTGIVDEHDTGMNHLQKVLGRFTGNSTVQDTKPVEKHVEDEKVHVNKDVGEKDKITFYRKPKVLHKSLSLFEVVDGNDIADDAVNKCLSRSRSSLPADVVVDEDGYTLRSARSKSCIVL